MKKFIYKEDHQLYYFIPIVFETDAKITAKKMEEISYQWPGAGHHSTSFDEFKELMQSYGYVVNRIEDLPENTIPENNVLDIVKGAIGSY